MKISLHVNTAEMNTSITSCKKHSNTSFKVQITKVINKSTGKKGTLLNLHSPSAVSLAEHSVRCGGAECQVAGNQGSLGIPAADTLLWFLKKTTILTPNIARF